MSKDSSTPNESNELNELFASYQSKQIRAFSSFEEMNEADAQENAAISPETHLQNASERAQRIFFYDSQKPMDKKITFKDGHSD